MKFALFIITKLFDYLYIGLVLLNFLYILQPCREELYGYRKQTEGASCLKGTDSGGAGRPLGAFQGVYLSAGTQSDLPLYRYSDGYSPVYGNYKFFTEEPEEQIVFGTQDYFEKVDPEYNNEIKWIIPNAQKNTMEPILLTLKAGGSTYPDTPHEGEEFGYILKGSVSIHLGKKTYHAKKGESFYYTADKKHYLSSKNGAMLIWVSSPPSF